MSRFLKKLTHKYEFLKLELEEVDESLEEYTKEWGKLYGKYFIDKSSEMWVNEETGEIRKEIPPEEEDVPLKEEKPEKLRKLYRKLSTYTHPDKGGNVDDFNAIKESYENEDLLELLKYAGLYQIDFELEEDDEQLIEQSCTKIQTQIEAKKNTMAWTYFTGDKNKKRAVLNMIQQQLGVEIEVPEELLD